MARPDATHQDGFSSGTATPEPQFDHDETPLTQVAGHHEDSDEIEGEGPYVILEGISDKSFSAKIPFEPGCQAITVGRCPACTIRVPDDIDALVSRQHFVVITLGSGFYVVCVGQNGMFVIRNGERIECPIFQHKAPFQPGGIPTKKNMVKIQAGDTLQLGRGATRLGPMGEAIFPEYKKAEYKIVKGDGECGTGERTNKNKKKRKLDSTDGDVPPHFESKARRKTARAEGQARRFSEAQRSISKCAKAADTYGSKGPNTKANTSDKREMKSMLQRIFTVYNVKGKGKGKGKGTTWTDGSGKGKGKGVQSEIKALLLYANLTRFFPSPTAPP